MLNKRRKPIKKPGKPTPIRKTRNHYLRMDREAKAQELFDRNIKKEREIGVHPKYLNSYRRQWVQPAEVWEKLEKQWEERN